MRALSLWQPWASLIAAGGKRWETRSWGTDYRGEVLIHAALRKPPEVNDHRFVEEAIQVLGRADFDTLPRGKVVAICELTDCLRVIPDAPLPRPQQYGGPGEIEMPEAMVLTYGPVSDRRHWREYLFGDWSVGRYVWRLENIRPLKPALQLRGMRGLWTAPADVVAQVEQRLA